MTPEEKFKEMVKSAEEAIEDFNNFPEDKAIVWAAKEIKRLTKENEYLQIKVRFLATK